MSPHRLRDKQYNNGIPISTAQSITKNPHDFKNYSKQTFTKYFKSIECNKQTALTHHQKELERHTEGVRGLQVELIQNRPNVIAKSDKQTKTIFTVETLPSNTHVQKLLIKKVQKSTSGVTEEKNKHKHEKEGLKKKKKKTKEITIHPYTIYTCKFCHQAFFDRITSNIHRDLAHPVRDKFFCAICNNGWAYKGKRRLLEHMQYMHCAEEKCPFCIKVFRKVRLDIHIKVVHSKEREHCKHCKKGFGTKLQMRRHIRRAHVDPEDWKCECNICGKKFSEHARLNAHKAIHNPQNITCSVCGKTFAMASYLSQHMKTHNKDDYKCPLCPLKAFSFVTTLRLHISSHHPNIKLPPPGTVLKNYNWDQILKSAQLEPKISNE